MTARDEKLTVFSFLLLLAGAATADSVTDQAHELLDKHQAGAAYDLLLPLSDERAGDPQFDFLLGIAALDAGHPNQAVFALERVLAVKPDDALARAEIARAYYALSEFETSRHEFENVKASSNVPPEARAAMDQYLAQIDRTQHGEKRISGYLGFSAGYDTNINSGTDESTVAIPILGNLPFQLVDSARSQENGFGAVTAGVNLTQPVNQNWAVVGGARGYYRGTESPFSTADIYLYSGVRGTYGKHEFTFAGQGEDFRVDGDSLRHVYGGFGQWTYALDGRSRLSLSFQATALDYPGLANRDAMRYVGSAGYLIALPGAREPVVYAGLYGGIEDENHSLFPQFGHDLVGGRLGGSIGVMPKTRAFASVSFEQRDYHGDDPIFLRTRDDTQFTFSTGLEYMPLKNWTVRPNISYTDNNSNISINDYDRVIVGIDATMQF